MLDSILDAFETILRTSQASLPGGLDALGAGEAGVERRLRRGEDLTPGQLPHVFLHDAAGARARVEGGSIERTLAVRGELWVDNESFEEAWSRLEALDAELEADATLGGIVADALVIEATTERYEARARSRVPFSLAVRWVDAPAPGTSAYPLRAHRTLLTDIATKIEAATAYLGDPATALPSDLAELVDLAGAVAPGARRYQLQALPAGIRHRGSNTTRERVRVRLRVLAALDGDDAERDYVWDGVQLEMAILVNPAWWTDISGVRGVLEGPDVELERPVAGAVVVYTVEIDLDVDEGA